MPLSFQATRKTPATGANVRPPWGSSGWSKSGAMDSSEGKTPPPGTRPRSGLTRREANVSARATPTKPQATPRVSSQQASTLSAVCDKENPTPPSTPTAPALPFTTHATRSSPFAAPFAAPFTGDLREEEEQPPKTDGKKEESQPKTETTDGTAHALDKLDELDETNAPNAVAPNTSIGLGCVGGLESSFATPVRMNGHDFEELLTGKAQDGDDCCLEKDVENAETAAEAANAAISSATAAPTDDRDDTETLDSSENKTNTVVSIKKEMPSPVVCIASDANECEANESEANECEANECEANASEANESEPPQSATESPARLAETFADPFANRFENRFESPAPAAKPTSPSKCLATPFTASKSAKTRPAPDPNELLVNGGDPFADLRFLSKPGGVLFPLFTNGDAAVGDETLTQKRTEAALFATKLAGLATQELCSVRAQLRLTPKDHVQRRDALRAVADRAADWLRALHPAFAALAGDVVDQVAALEETKARLQAFEVKTASEAVKAAAVVEKLKRAVAAAKADAEAEAQSASTVEATAKCVSLAKADAEALVKKRDIEIDTLREQLVGAQNEALAAKQDVAASLEAAAETTREAERDAARTARAARRGEVGSLKLRAKKAERALAEERDRLAVCLTSLETCETSLDASVERAAQRERDACAAEARAEAWRLESQDARNTYNDLFDDLKAQVNGAKAETERAQCEAGDAREYAAKLRHELKVVQAERDEAFAATQAHREKKAGEDADSTFAAVTKIVNAHDAVAAETLVGLEETIEGLRATLRTRDGELSNGKDACQYEREQSKRVQGELKSALRDAEREKDSARVAKQDAESLRGALRDALSAAETQRRDHEASVSESARAKTQRDGYETQIERLTTRLASVELRCVSALAEAANAKGTLEAQRVAFATERDAEIVTLRRRATGFQETQATLRRALANAESALVTATARALRAEAQSADVMTKSVEMLEDARKRVGLAETNRVSSRVGETSASRLMETGSSLRPLTVPSGPVPAQTFTTAPVARVVLQPKYAAAPQTVPFPKLTPAPAAARFVPTWSVDVTPDATHCDQWTPALKGLKTPARRAMFVSELLGNINALE